MHCGGTAVKVRSKCLMKPVATKKPCTKHIEMMKARLTASGAPNDRFLKISKMFRGDCSLGSEFWDLCGLFI